MINFIGIIILLTIEATIFIGAITYYKEEIKKLDNQLAERDRENGKKTSIIVEKNKIIDLLEETIKELKNENRQLKRENYKRLQKNS